MNLAVLNVGLCGAQHAVVMHGAAGSAQVVLLCVQKHLRLLLCARCMVSEDAEANDLIVFGLLQSETCRSRDKEGEHQMHCEESFEECFSMR